MDDASDVKEDDLAALFRDSYIDDVNLSDITLTNAQTNVIAQALTSTTHLRALDVSRTSCGSLPGICEWGRGFGIITSLTTLDLAANHLDEEFGGVLGAALSTNRSITKLDLSSNDLGDQGADAIISSLRLNMSLHTLNVTKNNITSQGVRNMAEALGANSALQVLDMSSNDLRDDGAASIAAALSANTSIKTLHVIKAKISHVGICALAQALHVNRSLLELNLASNNPGSEGFTALGEAVTSNNTLKVLVLNGCNREGIEGLCEGIARNHGLESLSLVSCRLTETCGTVIASLLQNSTLTTLDLAFNHLQDGGVQQLGVALANNSTLQTLDLTSNVINHTGVDGLTQGLLHNTSLGTLIMSGNKFGKGMEAIKKLVQSNISLHSLSLASCFSHGIGSHLLAQALHRNSSLRTLDVSEYTMQISDALYMAVSLTHNDWLQSLNMSMGMPAPGAHAVAAMLMCNHTLKDLNISGHTFDQKGIESLSKALIDNTSLHSLDISLSSIQAHGAKSLADALVKNKTLLKLSVTLSYDWEADSKFIHAAISANSSIQYLTLKTRTSTSMGVSPYGYDGTVLETACNALRTCRKFHVMKLTFSFSRTHHALSFHRLGLPPGSRYWSVDQIVWYLQCEARDVLVAFCMGQHPRLGVCSLICMLRDDQLHVVCNAYFGLI